MWADYRNTPGSGDVYLRRSVDGGRSWLPTEVALETDPAVASTAPVVAASGASVFVAWRGFSSGNSRVYCSASPDRGASWTAPVPVDSGDMAFAPKIASSGLEAVLTWEDRRGGIGDSRVYARRVTVAWPNLILANEARLDPNDTEFSEAPEIAAAGSKIYVTWGENMQALVMRSPDAGTTWMDRTNVGAGLFDLLPQSAASGSYAYATWYEAGSRDIFFTSSANQGVTWSPLQRLDSSPGPTSLYPDIGCNGARVHVAWSDSRNTPGDIYVRRSNDAGATWVPEQVLDSPALSPTGESYGAQVSVYGSTVGVCWEERFRRSA